MRRLSPIIWAGLALLLATSSHAQGNKTSRSWDCYWGEYFVGHLSAVGNKYYVTMMQQGYIVYQHTSDWRVGDAPVTITQVVNALKVGYGVWFSNTHTVASSTTLPATIYGSVVEVYPPTTQGLADRDRAMTAYRQDATLKNYVGDGSSAGGYYIYLKPSAYQDFFYSWDTFVYNGCCLGHAYASYWKNARCVLDYNYSVTNVTVKANVDTIFTRMNGQRRIDQRPLLSAYTGTQVSFTGDLNTVLSPTVISRSALPSVIRVDEPVEITFDTEMDPIGSFAVAGPVNLGALSWITNERLSFTVGPWWASGPGSIALQSYDLTRGQFDGFRSTGGIGLDGNTVNPGGRDDYLFSVVTQTDNPAASVAWFRAVRKTDGVHVEWSVESQSGTDHYLVEYAAQPNGPFTVVATVPLDTARTQYAVIDWGRTDGYYRLREVEVDGDILDQGFDGVNDPVPNVPVEPVSVAVGDSLTSHGLQLYPTPPPPNATEQIMPIYGVTYITRSGWESVLQPRLNKLAGQGHIVNVLSIESFGTTKAAQRAGISQYITAGIPYGLWAVCLAGDNEDSEAWDAYPWYDWVKPTWPNEAAADIIPSFYWPDPSHQQAKSQTWYTPHGNSDFPYAGPDSIPRIVVTRIPARTVSELATAVVKADAYERQDLSRGTIAVFTQAQDLGGNSGALALKQANTNIAKIPRSYRITHAVDSPSTNLTYAARQAQFIATMSPTDPTNRVVGTIYKGTQSNRNNLHWQQYSQGFRWNLLPPNAGLTAVLATYCEAAGTSRRIDPSAARGFMELAMTTYSDRGPALIIGANCGSNQKVNGELDSLFLSIVNGRGARSAADAWVQAIQMLLATHPGDMQRKYAALTTGVIGFPETPWPGMRVAITGVEPVAGSARQLQLSITPNPSRQPTIRFAVPSTARTTLAVYDVSGRLVSRLLNDELRAGQYHARLDQPLAAGLYFVRLSVGAQTMNERMVILH